MDAATWKRIKQVFAEVSALGPGLRRERLEELCGGDEAIRTEVEALLASDSDAGDFIEESALAFLDISGSQSSNLEGRHIGHYRIVREIGRGGMGAVFLAERSDGEFEQQVAIKILGSAFPSHEAINRFRQERQILARLEHPNIARLLDGGVTDEGLPYLVMEYVDGKPLTAFTAGLSVKQKLRLFLQICRAFAYAHSNLVVHRDVKPSNILVTNGGIPKLLDFGLAKMLDLDDPTQATVSNFRALTPAYASPEQLKGEAITTASDIYSLGVVLYELMTGVRPFEDQNVSFEKMVQIVSGSEPQRPSACHTGIDDGPVPTARERSALKGDIDNIILMAMRREPTRRYRSAEQFADDIDRHLRGLPVIASEDTLFYRTSKFVGRHWAGVSAVAAVIVVLLAGIFATSWQAEEARRARERAETITAFLQNMLGSAAPEAGVEVGVKDVLAEAGVRARRELADDPEALAQVLMTLGRTYIGLTMEAKAETELRDAAALSEATVGAEHSLTSESLAWLGIALGYQAKVQEGLEVSRRAVEIERKMHPDGNAVLGYALFAYASNLIQTPDTALALATAREASDVIKGTHGETHPYYLATLNQIALVQDATGNTDEAIRIYSETLARTADAGPKTRIYAAQAGSFLGTLLVRLGRFDEAEPRLEQALAAYKVVIGDRNPSIALLRTNLAKIYMERGDGERALKELEFASAVFAELPPTNRYGMQTRTYHALAAARTGDPIVGERIVGEVIASATASAPQSLAIAEAKSTLAEILTIQRKYEQAEQLLAEAISLQEPRAAAIPYDLDLSRKRLAALHNATGRSRD